MALVALDIINVLHKLEVVHSLLRLCSLVPAEKNSQISIGDGRVKLLDCIFEMIGGNSPVALVVSLLHFNLQVKVLLFRKVV